MFYWKKLHARRQREGESIVDFCEGVRRLAERCLQDWTIEQRRAKIIRQFIFGLRDSHLAETLLSYKLTTPAMAVILAEDLQNEPAELEEYVPT